jgi:hypothetical protein
MSKILKGLGIIGAAGVASLAGKNIIDKFTDEKVRLRLEKALEGLSDDDLEFILSLERDKVTEWLELPKQLQPIQLKKWRDRRKSIESSKTGLVAKALSYMADRDGKTVTLEEKISGIESLYDKLIEMTRTNSSDLSRSGQDKLIAEILEERNSAIQSEIETYKPEVINFFASEEARKHYNSLNADDKLNMLKQYVASSVKSSLTE